MKRIHVDYLIAGAGLAGSVTGFLLKKAGADVLAKTGGYEITKEEAEAYMAELEDVELDEENIKKIAGGKKPGACCGTLVQWFNNG